MNLLFRDKAFIIGFVGDLILQIISKYYGKFAGLERYYKLHGPFESLIIAGGLMYFIILIYDFFNIKHSILYLSIYATVLDILFRYLRLFTTLDEYYARFNVIQTIIFAIISVLLIFII